MFLMQLFENDIEYLLSMEKLWQKRRRPTPLKLNSLSDTTEQGGGIYPHALLIVFVKVISKTIKQLYRMTRRLRAEFGKKY